MLFTFLANESQCYLLEFCTSLFHVCYYHCGFHVWSNYFLQLKSFQCIQVSLCLSLCSLSTNILLSEVLNCFIPDSKIPFLLHNSHKTMIFPCLFQCLQVLEYLIHTIIQTFIRLQILNIIYNIAFWRNNSDRSAEILPLYAVVSFLKIPN